MSAESNEARYSRHQELIPPEPWDRLCSSRVVVAGAGGLGTHVLDMLARLAPMRIEIWDPASIDVPDLDRQTLYAQTDLGALKVEAARRRLQSVNSALVVECRAEFIDSTSPLGDAIGGITACFDCLDSFAARAALEKALIRSTQKFHKEAVVPLFHGGVSGYFGQAATLFPPDFGYARFFGPDFSRIPNSPKAVMPFSVAMIAAIQISLFSSWLIDSNVPSRYAKLIAVNCMDNSIEAIEIP